MANPIKIVRNVPRSHSDNWDNCATPEVAVVNDTMMAMLVELIG